MILQGVLNRLLGHSPAAMALLMPFAGRNVRLDTPMKSATLVITEDGRFGSSNAEPEATLDVSLSFFIIRTHSPGAAARQITCIGAKDLGGGVAQALALLRWDTTEDLSVLVGDMLARRLVKLACVIGGIPGALGCRLLATYAEYWCEENPLLPQAEDVERWQQEVVRLRDDLAKLERRIGMME